MSEKVQKDLTEVDIMSIPIQICEKLNVCNTTMGIYGQDSPKALIQYMLKSVNERESDLNAVILNGDFMAHTLTDNKTLDEGFNILNSIMTADLKMLRENIPNKPLLPTIGNNDVVVHNNVPCNDEFALKYYQGLFDIWFPKDHQPQGFDNEKVHESFL